MNQFPAQIECVLHGHVHALAGFGRVGVTRVTRGEHARISVFSLGNIVKFIGDAVTDVVDGPPHHFLHVDGIRFDDAIGRCNHVVLRELALGGFFAHIEFVQLHIHAEHVATFARQDEHVAFFG